MIVLPVMMTAVCGFLWVDSLFAVRRLPLIGLGDAAFGLKSAAGWLSWNAFWLWHQENPESAMISVPYWVLISVGLAFAWRGVVLRRKARDSARGTGRRSLRSGCPWPSFRDAPILSTTSCAISNPRDRYAIHAVYGAVDQVNRVDRGSEAAVSVARLLEDNTLSICVRAIRALGKLHADPKLVIPALMNATRMRTFVTQSRCH